MTFYTYLWLRENGTPYYVGSSRLSEIGKLGAAARWGTK